jgi:ribosomal protein S18 acetylase RimI-like enzyme
MQIRPMTGSDLDRLIDIDGTIESTQYLHLEQAGQGLAVTFSLQERPLRQKLVENNPLGDDLRFELRQVVSGGDEGVALVAEHEDVLVALLLAKPDIDAGTLRILDLRVDYDARRQGLATAMLYQIIQEARNQGLRAVAAHVMTNNLPASQLLANCGFELAGVDTRRQSNHDLVKEAVTLFWYASLD